MKFVRRLKLASLVTLRSLAIVMATVCMAASVGVSAQADSLAQPIHSQMKLATQLVSQKPLVIPHSTAQTTVTAPSCSPDTTYSTPTALDPYQDGVTETIDTPSTYTVYGTTKSQIMNQIVRCTPVTSSGTNGFSGRFAASTANTVTWNIAYESTPSGQCTINDVQVSLHINQVFPTWQPSSNASPALTRDWQTYSTRLHAYEQGHVALDEREAQTILRDLQNLPATGCDMISTAANAVASNDASLYLRANASYDQINNFGLKQNVVL